MAELAALHDRRCHLSNVRKGSLFALSGVGTAYQLAANAAFVFAVPAAVRGQAFGLAQGGIIAAQGTGILLAGAAGQRFAPKLVVAVAGGLGTAVAGLLAGSLRGAARRNG